MDPKYTEAAEKVVGIFSKWSDVSEPDPEEKQKLVSAIAEVVQVIKEL